MLLMSKQRPKIDGQPAMNCKILLLSTILLALVVRPSESTAQKVSPAMAKLLDTRDDKRCKKLGALPNTEAYVTCRLKLQEMAQDEWAAQDFAFQQLMNAQAERDRAMLASQFKPYQWPIPTHRLRPAQTTCTSNVAGDFIYTNCQQYP